MKPIYLALFGGGRRMKMFYKDICKWFLQQGHIKVVGICNRTPEKIESFAQELGTRVYRKPEHLLQQEKVDAAIVTVTPPYKDQLAVSLASHGVHLFIDSPVPGFLNGFRMQRLAKSKNLKIEIAEEQSFSPEAQFQKKILISGIFGRLQSVLNQVKEIDYHALARLHNLVGEYAQIMRVSSRNLRLPEDSICSLQEIEFTNLMYFSQYSFPKNHSLRLEKDFRLICEKGVISQNEIKHSKHGQLMIQKQPLTDDGSPQSVVNKLSIEINQQQFVWENSNLPDKWDRKHHGLYQLIFYWLKSLRSGSPLLYGLSKGLQDRSILIAWSLGSKTNLRIYPQWFPIINNVLWKYL